MKDILQIMANQGRKEINFGETAMGHRYLNHTVPELTRTIKRFTMALNTKQDFLSKKEIDLIQSNVKKMATFSVQNNDFYRTRQGINYYQNQLPRFVKALKEVLETKESEEDDEIEDIDESTADTVDSNNIAEVKDESAARTQMLAYKEEINQKLIESEGNDHMQEIYKNQLAAIDKCLSF